MRPLENKSSSDDDDDGSNISVGVSVDKAVVTTDMVVVEGCGGVDSDGDRGVKSEAMVCHITAPQEAPRSLKGDLI